MNYLGKCFLHASDFPNLLSSHIVDENLLCHTLLLRSKTKNSRQGESLHPRMYPCRELSSALDLSTQARCCSTGLKLRVLDKEAQIKRRWLNFFYWQHHFLKKSFFLSVTANSKHNVLYRLHDPKPGPLSLLYTVQVSTKKVTTRKQRKMKIDTNMTMDAKASIIIFNFNAFEDLNYHRKPNTIYDKELYYICQRMFLSTETHGASNKSLWIGRSYAFNIMA